MLKNVTKNEMYDWLYEEIRNEITDLWKVIYESNQVGMSVMDYMLETNKNVKKNEDGTYTYLGGVL